MEIESTSQINKKFQAATIIELPVLIRNYEEDIRAGVIKICESAKKKVAAFDKEIYRTNQMYTFEREYSDCEFICGIDEVGRGPLAGPVMAGAVVLPKNEILYYLNDSKKLSEKMREELYELIHKKAIATGIGVVEPDRIDEINILQATYEAMRMAVNNLGITPDILLVDAVTIPDMPITQKAIIKGDAKSASIAAASIIAKVTRDRLMTEMDRDYPVYGFASNKGYGSKTHIDAIKKYGASDIHRTTFISHFQ